MPTKRIKEVVVLGETDSGMAIVSFEVPKTGVTNTFRFFHMLSAICTDAWRHLSREYRTAFTLRAEMAAWFPLSLWFTEAHICCRCSEENLAR